MKKKFEKNIFICLVCFTKLHKLKSVSSNNGYSSNSWTVEDRAILEVTWYDHFQKTGNFDNLAHVDMTNPARKILFSAEFRYISTKFSSPKTLLQNFTYSALTPIFLNWNLKFSDSERFPLNTYYFYIQVKIPPN